jgi:hypothetical protein
MAVLYVTEFSDTMRQGGPIMVAMEPENASQTVAIGAGSVQSSAFANNTQLIRLETDAVCSVKFGTNPTATATNRRLQAGDVEYFGVPLGGSYKVAVITNT